MGRAALAPLAGWAARSTARLLLVVLALGGLTACESCDFSFGPIPLEVRVTPADVVATVQICDLEGKEWRCTTEQTGGADTGAEPAPGTLRTTARWDGYLACHHPALEIDVVAEGCKPAHVSVPKARPRGNDGPMRIEVGLDCG